MRVWRLRRRLQDPPSPLPSLLPTPPSSAAQPAFCQIGGGSFEHMQHGATVGLTPWFAQQQFVDAAERCFWEEDGCQIRHLCVVLPGRNEAVTSQGSYHLRMTQTGLVCNMDWRAKELPCWSAYWVGRL